MKLLVRILLPLIIIIGAVFFARYLIGTKPEPRSFDAPPQVTKVDATKLQPGEFQVFLETQGSVRPRTSTNLVPEVSGRIIQVSSKFRDGGFFEKDDVLLEIDPLNYLTQIAVAESNEAQAFSALRSEEIRGQQAIENFRRLGKGGDLSEMAARKPQLAEAQANYKAAQAEVEQASENLKRTKIRAPFNGRILEQNVDVGQYVSSSTQLARAFATDVMEVRLPLTNRQLAFVNLPEAYIDETEKENEERPPVLIKGKIGNREAQWKGEVVRVDGAIDTVSRQLFVVAEVEDPYRRKAEQSDETPPLKIGMFVDSLIKGVKLDDVFVLPRSAVRVGGEVILINEKNEIRRQKVEPVWSERDKVVILLDGGGLNAGDVLCLTPLAYPANGAKVIPTIDAVSYTHLTLPTKRIV